MGVRFERVTDAGHKLYSQAMELYHGSFPRHEQREAVSQENILHDGDYRFWLVYDEETFVGLLLCWETEAFIYVEHFCVLPEMRNKRYGQRTLECLEERGKKILLEIDPPADEISIRRRGFYERCGFKENPYPHIHPPYHRGSEGHPLVLMSFPARISAEEYGLFNRYLTNRVMKDAWGG